LNTKRTNPCKREITIFN